MSVKGLFNKLCWTIMGFFLLFAGIVFRFGKILNLNYEVIGYVCMFFSIIVFISVYFSIGGKGEE